MPFKRQCLLKCLFWTAIGGSVQAQVARAQVAQAQETATDNRGAVCEAGLVAAPIEYVERRPHRIETFKSFGNLATGEARISSEDLSDGEYVYLITDHREVIFYHKYLPAEHFRSQGRGLVTHRSLWREWKKLRASRKIKGVAVMGSGEFRILNGQVASISNRCGTFPGDKNNFEFSVDVLESVGLAFDRERTHFQIYGAVSRSAREHKIGRIEIYVDDEIENGLRGHTPEGRDRDEYRLLTLAALRDPKQPYSHQFYLEVLRLSHLLSRVEPNRSPGALPGSIDGQKLLLALLGQSNRRSLMLGGVDQVLQVLSDCGSPTGLDQYLFNFIEKRGFKGALQAFATAARTIESLYSGKWTHAHLKELNRIQDKFVTLQGLSR